MKDEKERDELRLRYPLKEYESDPDFLQLLTIIDEGKLPFKMPPEIYWPKNEKAKSTRALILMRCGLRYLEERYETRERESEEKESSTIRKGAVSADPFAVI